jgi:hypothetical protein
MAALRQEFLSVATEERMKALGRNCTATPSAATGRQITLMASALYRLLASRVGREYRHATAKKIFRNLLDVSATVEILEHEVVVTVDKRAHNPYQVGSRLADEPTPMPWLGGKRLVIRFA